VHSNAARHCLVDGGAFNSIVSPLRPACSLPPPTRTCRVNYTFSIQYPRSAFSLLRTATAVICIPYIFHHFNPRVFHLVLYSARDTLSSAEKFCIAHHSWSLGHLVLPKPQVRVLSVPEVDWSTRPYATICLESLNLTNHLRSHFRLLN